MSTTFGDKMMLYVSKKSYVKSLPIFLLAPLNSLKIFFFLGGGGNFTFKESLNVSQYLLLTYLKIWRTIENIFKQDLLY